MRAVKLSDVMYIPQQFHAPFVLFLMVGLMNVYVQSTLANDVEIAEIAERECGICHGEEGISETPSIPSIGGFSDSAILDLLTTYEHNFRKARTIQLDDGTETDMVEVIGAFTQPELDAIAMYYSEQTWTPIEQDYDPELAAEGARLHKVKCNKCHINGGSVQESDHALMAGQWREYLEGEFKNFDDGSRRMSSKMQQKYETLNAEGKQAIVEFYVSAGNF